MDAVSIDDQRENDFVKAFMKKNKIKALWTSGAFLKLLKRQEILTRPNPQGRSCDFPGCNGTFEGDILLNGWFWSADLNPIGPANKIDRANGWTYNPWSQTGHHKKPQPDNAEYPVNGSKEACLVLLQGVYEPEVGWHDVACKTRIQY